MSPKGNEKEMVDLLFVSTALIKHCPSVEAMEILAAKADKLIDYATGFKKPPAYLYANEFMVPLFLQMQLDGIWKMMDKVNWSSLTTRRDSNLEHLFTRISAYQKGVVVGGMKLTFTGKHQGVDHSMEMLMEKMVDFQNFREKERLMKSLPESQKVTSDSTLIRKARL